MKKFMNLAVAVIMMTLCAVIFIGCNDIAGEKYTDLERVTPTPTYDIRKDSCGATANTYQAGGAMTTRAAEVEHLDGIFTATSRMKAVFSLNGEIIARRTWLEINKIEGRGIYKPLYAKSLDSFKEQNVRMTDEVFTNGQTGKFVKFAEGDGHNFYYSFIITHEAEADTFQIWNPTKHSFEEFKRCHNELVELKFLSQRVTDLQRDSAGWHAYSLIHSYAGKLSEGPNNGFQYDVNIPLVWVWKGGGKPDYPEDKPEIIVYEDGDEGFDFVNDSTSQSWKDVTPRFTDGTRGKTDRIAVLVMNTIEEPEYQIKQVDNLSYTELKMEEYDEVTDGQPYDKENKISVTPFVKMVKTRTNQGECIYKLRREGRPIFTDSLGGKHYLPERSWSAKDDGWTDKKMDPTENFERLLIISHITGTFNAHNHAAKGEIELRKLKDAEKKIIGYEYPDNEKGIKSLTPNTFWTWRIQYILFSDNTKEKVGEIGTTLNLSTNVPERQVVTVTDWDIKDLSARPYDAVRGESRTDKVETGTFTIRSWSKSFETRTNKSSDKFVTTYDGTVIFKDKYGQEVEFIGLTVKQEDKGGVATLKDLLEADEMERKSMTTTINVTETHTSTSANHTAEIEFRKAVEKEELTDWKVTNQDLVYNGNGNWTSTTTVTYYWKLAGTKTETYSTGLVWNIVGEAKSQVILDEAKADYRTLNAGSETSSTSANGNITVVTKKKGYTEDYTTLKDNFTATMQTASYKSTVGGKTIAFDFLSPTSMTVAHANGSLVNGNRTTTKNGTEYDVWDHTGSVSATVISPKGNQTETAIDEKEILVKKEEPAIEPSNPEWGKPLGLLGQGTVVYQPGIGPSGQGVFYCNFNVRYEKGVVCYVTNTYIREGHTNPQDFAATGFWAYGSKLRGATLNANNVGDLNSAIFRDGKFEPACCTYVAGKGVWTYMSPDGREQGMSENLAETCGLKHFTGTNTAHLQPILYYTAKEENGALVIRNQYGGAVLSLR
jgi:hypothetical protein